jgi:voltage-gated potassium channel Kch
VQDARVAGLPVIYGDASHEAVLRAATISRSRALIATVPAYPDVRAIIAAARRLRPDLAIVARAEGFEAVRDLYALGIEKVVSPEFEAAIEMAREALGHLGVPVGDIEDVADAIRRERYSGSSIPQSRGATGNP